ncbi:MAG: ROK family protein [Candidatus Cloacimonadaceae bacterium]|jgi:glucokinase|nr:ROK family protein [Candidatus Cloacimonadota bacterium]MDY0127735.1 ROK family protein [Candidatus Cloacimonadaceae bacterium]MCB5255422.1 ROK family protein [Candidatus Cloacimonadota bacterium]MCK9178719.1 ROK family protein [Candidatus Cloacimonadota bacterium]MCK9242563.1 ROK family protein [Candidatus Cloacimonadota bacterium]
MKRYLGIDIGASSFKYGVGDSKHGLQCFDTIRIKEKSLSAFQEIIAQILVHVQDQEISGIGIGSPGTLRMPEGKLVGVNPNLPFFVGLSPRELIPKGFDLPVYVDNDANLMALAEANSYNCSEAIGLTIGSGIGCGIVINGEIYHGAHGFASEAGHCIMIFDGEECSCGQRGCLEAYSSVEGIRRRLQRRGLPYHALELPELIALRAVKQELYKVIEEGENLLIRAVANLITLLDPQKVILGGGGMDLGLYDIKRINRLAPKYLPKAHSQAAICVLAGFGNRAGVLGAITLCERKSGSE